MTFSRFLGLALLLVLPACEQARPSDHFRASGEAIAFGGADAGPDGACFTCHGMGGEGDGRLAPRLAGLDAGYLHRQLDDYATGRRDHVPMRAIVRRLTGRDRAKVAAYYAARPPVGVTTGRSAPSDAAVYARACASCHGAQGEGRGPGNPALAGQSAAYIEAQLVAWRTGRRYNDPLGEMRAISRRLSPREVSAVAAHVAALPAVRPRSAPAASP